MNGIWRSYLCVFEKEELVVCEVNSGQWRLFTIARDPRLICLADTNVAHPHWNYWNTYRFLHFRYILVTFSSAYTSYNAGPKIVCFPTQNVH